MEKKKIALVLASGGAKGFAHIGAIEALEESGYEITSIAGTSMGSLVGGIYAAGGLEKVKEWMFGLTLRKVLNLVDFTFSNYALVNGNRVIDALKEIVPDCDIESLPIPYCAVATDVKDGAEYVFRSGSLYEAIRASISIPMLFRPVDINGKIFIDGGITNGLPLDKVVRTPGDILVGVNLEDYEWDEDEEINDVKLFSNYPRISRLIPMKKIQNSINMLSNNYVSMAYNTISILMKRNTELSLQLTPPDIYLNIDVGEYGSYDYDKARELYELGKSQMLETLRNYESSRSLLIK